eukprot:CAMPEP_0194267474 /NCGR_PEP_ID=MMETSP0169-20130528/1954_1 /TAXON_ID=218684 /ORGANISM="Corethron pennatum, Strain L29A3" /LENGTH=205 /DNA_ID=CAMNT_0039008307 /DNA_START=88 /DNA_END=705 /DNA_ORIENTATION=+
MSPKRRVLFSSVPSLSLRTAPGIAMSHLLGPTLLSGYFIAGFSRDSPASCDSAKKNDGEDDGGPLETARRLLFDNLPTNGLDESARYAGAKITELAATGVPGEVSYGFVSGFCAGFALKKAGKVVAVVFGTGFVIIQSLSYAGYIEVNVNKVSEDVTKALDQTGDGKLDVNDIESISDKAMEILHYNIPAGGGFATGVIAGVRAG